MTKMRACDIADVAPESVRQVVLPSGDTLALYHLDGEYYASDDLCTHGAAFLSEGDIEDGNIVCPFHGGMFDIKTGDATAAPCVTPVRTYPVTIDGDGIYIDPDVGS